VRETNVQRALGHIVFEESSADVDDAVVNRLAELLESVEDEEADWWHRKWHQDTGIPCDGSRPFCPLVSRREPLCPECEIPMCSPDCGLPHDYGHETEHLCEHGKGPGDYCEPCSK
jgi:hypothetical protein